MRRSIYLVRERIRIVDSVGIGLDNGIGNFLGTRLCCALKSETSFFFFFFSFFWLLFPVAVSFNVLITLKRRRQGVDRLKARQINWVGYPVRIWILQFNTLI